MSTFDPSDKPLLTELAETHTCAQLADKWGCSYRKMFNYLYRHNIKPVLWLRPARKRKVSDTVQRIIELHQKGCSVTDISLQTKRSVQYVSVILKRADCDPVSTRRREMIAKANAAIADAKKHGDSFTQLALIYYGWSNGKARYWLEQSKKAPNK